MIRVVGSLKRFSTFKPTREEQFTRVFLQKNLRSAKKAGEISAQLEKIIDHQTNLINEIKFKKMNNQDFYLQSNEKDLKARMNRIEEQQRELKQKKEKLLYVHQKVAQSVIPLADSLTSCVKQAIVLQYPPQNIKKIKQCHETFIALLAKWHITEFDPKDQLFDPQFHQSISKVDAASNWQKGYVCNTTRTGFKIESRLLRPALVIVYA